MADVDNSQDVLDSRDVIERLEEFTDELEALEGAVTDAQDVIDEEDETTTDEERADNLAALHAAEANVTAWHEENDEEFKPLKAFADEAENYADDWLHGATLIRETYFTDYCEEMVKDIGDLPQNIPGYLVIDWEATANNIKADYTEIDFDGVAYLVR